MILVVLVIFVGAIAAHEDDLVQNDTDTPKAFLWGNVLHGAAYEVGVFEVGDKKLGSVDNESAANYARLLQPI